MSQRETLAVVAGSGLDLRPLLDHIDEERGFRDVPGLAAANVAGHTGQFVFGRTSGVRVILQCGRLHVYEGRSLDEAAATVSALRAFGASRIVFTNAAGGLLKEMQPADLMAVDEIRTWPYAGWDTKPRELAPDFVPDGCEWRGAYHWVHGPCYETRAEIAALCALGSAAVGMSTAPEMIRARELGIPAAAISCITNNCHTAQVLTHAHVLRSAAAASAKLCSVIRELALSGSGARSGKVSG